MVYVLGFLIAIAIGLTGVGAGTLTTPLLVLLIGVPARAAVGTSLIFGAVVKIITAPVYMARRQVDWRTLSFMLAGGVPGALIGVSILRGVDGKAITGIIGATIVVVALFNIFRPASPTRHDRAKWLALVCLPIGTEVGFSSAGAGALGALSLLSLTKLAPAAVVGTDLVFGLVVSLLAGGVNAAMGNLSGKILLQLLVGGIPGAIIGGMLAGRVPAKQLRMGLSGAMAALGVTLFYRGFF